MAQALTSELGQRYDVMDSYLTTVQRPKNQRSDPPPDAAEPA
jgi:hypothetical protein